ncbi:hypothetical protein, conserved [Leishmania tarentolae]|uniref:Uncharacterized protein n=1 Tax=Leishmania tarentolae TaxID=5689 RepID=A0A640KMA7_LEITA|nr:hypothetical protein, conserved [Leishmania tarentolae]
MDPVQELITGVGPSDMENGHRSAQAPSLSSSTALDTSQASAPAFAVSAPPKRTKMVFLYSDEDDVGGDNDSEGFRTTRPASGVAEVLCDDHAIDVSEGTLAELQKEAAELREVGTSHTPTSLSGANADADGFSFEEDVLSGLVGSTSAPFTTDSGMRVREVTAPRLWEGAVVPDAPSSLHGGGAHAASQAAADLPILLRRGLPAANFVLQSRRKRFREVPVLASDTAQSLPKKTAAATTFGEPSAASSAAAPESVPQDSSSSELHVHHLQRAQRGDGSFLEDSSDDVEVEVEEELDVYPVYEEDGKTVRALRTRFGYELTLDERDLLEDCAEGDEGEGHGGQDEDAAPPAAAGVAEGDEEADNGAHDSCSNDALSMLRTVQSANSAAAAAEDDEDADADLPVQAEAEDWGDFQDFDDEEDEEEAELDEAIIVAVVEQLVRCCEAEDLDPHISVEAARFIDAAKPLLSQLTNELISPTEFVQRMDRDLRRFQRIYKSIYRPRDSPIVIDGVVTDL